MFGEIQEDGAKAETPWVINTIRPPAYYCSKLLSTSFKIHIPLINTLCWVHRSQHRGTAVPFLNHLFISVIRVHFH